MLLLARAGIYGIKLYNALRFSFVVCLAYWGTGISMVAVAQLVESSIVIPVVAGSSPVSHPIYSSLFFVLLDCSTSAGEVLL